MGIIVYAKIRKIGTSAGILLPREKLQAIKQDIGDEIEVAIFPRRKDLSGFGIAKTFAPFRREKKARKIE